MALSLSRLDNNPNPQTEARVENRRQKSIQESIKSLQGLFHQTSNWETRFDFGRKGPKGPFQPNIIQACSPLGLGETLMQYGVPETTGKGSVSPLVCILRKVVM
mmetsp:Transcript_15461/g.20765  ORF Transcript_15461/g.20765 Transcript_15461/m.20765 type:complete len:104 (-) Transcript_15461:709-1020(-)